MVVHGCNVAIGSLGHDDILQAQSQPGLHVETLCQKQTSQS